MLETGGGGVWCDWGVGYDGCVGVGGRGVGGHVFSACVLHFLVLVSK